MSVLLTEYLLSATHILASDHRKYDCCSQATQIVVAWVFSKNIYSLIKLKTELLLTRLGGLIRPVG